MVSRWLWLLFVLNTLAGLLFSPATAVRRVRIVGAEPQEVRSLRESLQTIRGVPALRVDESRFLGRILAEVALQDASWQQNWFGRGVLTLTRRTPVLTVSSKDKLVLGQDGTLFRTTAELPKSQLRTGSSSVKPSYTWAGTWEGRAVARFATILHEKIPLQTGVLVLDQTGKLTLASGKLAPVVLGTTDNAAAKVAQLAKALSQQPKLLEQVKEVNLSAPENPRYIPLANDPIRKQQ